MDPLLNQLINSNSRRFAWANRLNPVLGEDALGFVLDVLPYWVRCEQPAVGELMAGNIAISQWFDEHSVPMVAELLTDTNFQTSAGTDDMTDKSPIAKTLAYIERHGLTDKIKLNENNTIHIPDDLVETTAAMDAGITLDQIKKFDKAKGELLPAVTHVAGQLSGDAFKADPNLTETGFSYSIGTGVKVSGVFNRDAKDHTVVVVETTHRSAEFNRVVTGLNAMFDDINN
ncbi:hypothetical protein D3C85_88170 [compost metagenome]